MLSSKLILFKKNLLWTLIALTVLSHAAPIPESIPHSSLDLHSDSSAQLWRRQINDSSGNSGVTNSNNDFHPSTPNRDVPIVPSVPEGLKKLKEAAAAAAAAMGDMNRKLG